MNDKKPAPTKETPFEAAMRQADSYEKKREYGSGIEVLEDFWKESRNAEEGKKANARVDSLRVAAEADWAKVEAEVRSLAKSGEKTKALELLFEAEGFGISSISEAATKIATELDK